MSNKVEATYHGAIDRPVHREQCPCGATFIGPALENEIRRTWVLAHAKHWETEEDDA